jgi:hypothetical protein
VQVNPQRQLVLIIIFGILFATSPAYCSTYFVDPNGNDTTGTGAIGSPWKTIPKAATAAVAGDTIYVRGGTHVYTTTIALSSSGTSSAYLNLFAYNNEKPVLDFSAMAFGSSNRGINLTGSYWHFKGINIYKAGDNGMWMSGSYNIIELCTFYENQDSGLQISGGASYDQIINCDSYYNYDAPNSGGNADGFSPKMDVGTGIYFYGCRSWQNSDDGYDGYLRPSDDVNVTYDTCWAFKNGYLKDANSSVHGNGNGFKMGGSDSKNLRHNATLKNCLAFANYQKGFDQNHDVGSMTLYNCTAYNNGANNFYISDTLASGKTATITNCTYCTGSYSLASFVVQTTNSWGASTSNFVSVDPSAAYGPRQADGSLPNITFMHLAAGSALIDAGTNVGLPYCGSKPDIGCYEYCPGSLPGAASSPTPSNGATGISTTQDLSWTAGFGATSHDVYFGTTSPGILQGNQTGTTFDPGTMTPGTTYYWRIDEANSIGKTTGTVWSFTTVPPPPPGTASNPTPSNGATGVSYSQDISWTAGSGATSHDVYFGTAATPPLVSSGQTATTYDTGTMAGNTTYYWRINEKNAGGTTTGAVWSFTTVSLPLPGAASNPTPASGATNVSATQTLSWTAGSNTTSHDVYFGTVNPPPSIGNQTAATYSPGTMAYSTTYYWRINEKNATGTTTGTVWNFTTAAPSTDANIIGSWLTGTTHAKETGTNRVLVFIAHGELASAAMSLSSVTYGGQSMTKVIEYNYNVASGNAYAGAFILNEAGITATTSSTFTATWSGTTPSGYGYSSAFFTNVNQTTTTGATGTGGTTSNPVTTSSALSTSSGDMVILGATCGNSGSYTLNNSFIKGAEQTMTGGVTGVTGHKHATGAAETPSATYSSTINRQMIIGFVLKAASVSPPGAASNPTPADSAATNVSVTQDLSWTAGAGATSRDIYFGTVNPPPSIGNQTAVTYDTGTMTNSTTYYWRINEKNTGGTTTGTVWSFTTQADTTAPAAPAGLTATAGYIPVKLDWNNNSESDLAGYNVYRSTTSGSGYSKLNSTLLTDSNYIDDINTTDITYYYVVTAVDTHSNESTYSSQVFSGLYGDFTGNKIVKFDDLARFATYWLLDNCAETAGVDLNGDCNVDFDEFAAFADNWMK